MKSKFYVVLLMLSLYACSDEDFLTPTLETNEATNIAQNDVQLNGTLTSKGSNEILELGFEISLDAAELANGNGEKITIIQQLNSLPFDFSATADQLEPNKEYFFRAYAKSGDIEVYGDILSYITLE